MLPIPAEVRALERRGAARGRRPSSRPAAPTAARRTRAAIAAVDALGERMNAWVYEQARRLTAAGKLVGVVGGDHSVPFGAIRAAAEEHPGPGRPPPRRPLPTCATPTRASAGRTRRSCTTCCATSPAVARIVQVGIRDYSDDEDALITANPDRAASPSSIPTSAAQLFDGEAWSRITHRIVAALPREVYLSFDIDGLDPALCPHTGTPVPGGLSFPEVSALLRAVVETRPPHRRLRPQRGRARSRRRGVGRQRRRAAALQADRIRAPVQLTSE